MGHLVRTYNNDQDLDTMYQLLDLNNKGYRGPLPKCELFWNTYINGGKADPQKEYNVLTSYTEDKIPPDFPGWDALIITEEVPKFSYKWVCKK